MNVPRPLVIGVLASLALGVLVSTAQSSVAPQQDGSAIRVPVGRLGDRFVYATFVDLAKDLDSGGAVTDAGDAEALLDPEADGFIAGVVDRTGRIFDRYGLPQDVLIVKVNATLEGETETTHDYVSLSRRTPVRTDVHDSKSGSFYGRQLATSHYGPHETPLWGWFYQGRDLRLGETLSDAATLDDGPQYYYSMGVATSGQRRMLFLRLGEETRDAWEGNLLVRPDTTVARRALVGGVDAYEVVSKAVVATPPDQGNPSWAPPLAGKTLYATRSEWLSTLSPYPLLVVDEFGFVAGGHQVPLRRTQHTLVESTAGSEEVPWDRPGASMSPREVERTLGTQFHPQDGTGSRLPYPLSRAIEDVEGPLKPLSYIGWQRQHPGALLVSAELRYGESSRSQAPTYLWHLVYAVPEGAGFELSTTRSDGDAFAQVLAHGERTVPKFTVADFPVRPITIADSERVWSETASDAYATRRPNFVHWGFDFTYRTGTTCLDMGGAIMNSRSAVPLRRILVGSTTEGSCVEKTETLQESALFRDTGTGNLLGFYEVQADFQYRGRVGPHYTQAHAGIAQSKAAATALRPPEIEAFAVASSSFVAAFLALYFFPALKFLGTKLWFVLPGYARVRKEDVLENKIRERLLQAIEQDPGVTASDLGRRVEAGWGTIVYHLSVLERNKLVSSLVDGRYHRFFPVDDMDWSGRGAIAALKHERTRQIYDLVLAEPGLPQDRVAAQAGVSAPTAIWHLKRLEALGMVGRARRGRRVHYFANDAPYAKRPSDADDRMEVA